MGQPIRPLIERILDGQLTDVLVDCRRQKMSHERIARHLGTEYEIEVTGEQVRKWCIESDVDALIAAGRPTEAAS